MTDTQFGNFQACFGTVSRRVARRILNINRIKAPLGVVELLGFTYGQLSSCTGYSRQHIFACAHYNRKLTPACLEAWRALIVAACHEILGADYDVEFSRGVAGRVVTHCPVCKRRRIVHYRGENRKCRTHG